MEVDKYVFLAEMAKQLWSSASEDRSKMPTQELIRRLKFENEKMSKSYNVLELVLSTKELVSRYNTNKMDKYRLHFIKELTKVPPFIRKLVKLDETI